MFSSQQSTLFCYFHVQCVPNATSGFHFFRDRKRFPLNYWPPIFFWTLWANQLISSFSHFFGLLCILRGFSKQILCNCFISSQRLWSCCLSKASSSAGQKNVLSEISVRGWSLIIPPFSCVLSFICLGCVSQFTVPLGFLRCVATLFLRHSNL